MADSLEQLHTALLEPTQEEADRALERLASRWNDGFELAIVVIKKYQRRVAALEQLVAFQTARLLLPVKNEPSK